MGLLNDAAKADAFSEADQLRAIRVQEVGDLTSNARWYATLVVGLLAGLVKYRELTQAGGLRHFAIVVFLLGLALAIFVSAALTAQYSQVELLRRLRSFAKDVHATDRSGTLNTVEAANNLSTLCERMETDPSWLRIAQ